MKIQIKESTATRFDLIQQNLNIPNKISIIPFFKKSGSESHIFYEDNAPDFVKLLKENDIEYELVYPIKHESIVWYAVDPTLFVLPSVFIPIELISLNIELFYKLMLTIESRVINWLNEPISENKKYLKRQKKLARLDFIKERSNGDWLRIHIEIDGNQDVDFAKIVKTILESDDSLTIKKKNAKKVNSDMSNPPEILFSYCHADELMREKIDKSLSVLKRTNKIEAWHDGEVTAGSDFEKGILEKLNSCEIILLLVSQDFLASNFCYDTEMLRAMERHEKGEAKVIPIILRDCDWHDAPFGKLLALPKDGKPITSWNNEDEALADIARGIKKAVKEFEQKINP